MNRVVTARPQAVALRRVVYDAAHMDRTVDRDVVERLLQRNEDALREVIERYSPLVYGMARRVVVDPALAEEVAQDTFLALWRRPGAFDPDRGTLQTFLAGVARNKAVDAVRREGAVRRARDSLAVQEAGTSADRGSYEEIEERHRVASALHKLSEVQREAIVLAYFGGRTYREVAAELGIAEGTAKTRLRDGLIRLRELLRSADDS